MTIAIPQQLTQMGLRYDAFIGRAGLENATHPQYKMKHEGWVAWKPFTSLGVIVVSPPDMQQEWWAAVAAGVAPGGGTGGGAGGGGSQSAAQAMAATQAGQPQFTGGGAGFSIGAAQVARALPARQDEWKGIDSLTPDNKLISTSPRSVNWDAFRKNGSRCIRSGIAKLAEDIGTVHDGSTATTTVTCIAKASFTASTDYIIFRKANGATHAFWFDTTGGDTEPGGSAAADARTQVDISGDTTAADVSDALTTAINGAAIGITAVDGAGTVSLSLAASGYLWFAQENVTNASFTMPNWVVSGAAVNNDYRGLSLCALPFSAPNNDQVLLAFHDTDVPIGTNTSGQQPTLLSMVTLDPRWARPKNLTGCPGPAVTLSDQTAQVLRVTAAYTNIFPAAQAEFMKSSVVGIIIRIAGPHSGATPRFPLDPDDADPLGDGTGSVFFTVSGTDQNRVSWDGTSTTYDMDLSGAGYGAGKYWVTVWGVSREGLSEPSKASITLA